MKIVRQTVGTPRRVVRESYQGWSNYPTWAVNLALGNDEEYDSAIREMASETKDPVDLGDRIAEFVDEIVTPDLEGAAYLVADLVRGSLSLVDWIEIAEAFLE